MLLHSIERRATGSAAALAAGFDTAPGDLGVRQQGFLTNNLATFPPSLTASCHISGIGERQLLDPGWLSGGHET